MDGQPFREIDDSCWDSARRLADCDRDGVAVQVLSTVPVMFCYGAKPADGLDLARLLNDHLVTVVSGAPTRFVGLGTVPLQDPGLAIRELERCIKELHLPGVQIGSHVNTWNLDAAELFPFFECAAELGAAVFIHPWEMLGKDRLSKYWLPWLVGMPAETCAAICSVLFGGVLERLPSLRLCFAHGGGSFPGTFGRIERGFQARPDLVAVDNPVNPRAYLGKFYVDSLTHDADILRWLIHAVGTHRIALGSDYPFPLGEVVPGALIESMSELTAAERDQLLAATALEFLRLDRSSFQ